MEQDSLPAWYQAPAEKQIDADYFAHRQWDSRIKLPCSIIQYHPAASEDC
jgi:hypothetical protein